MALWCPVCGEHIDALMEAHNVGVGKSNQNGQGRFPQTSPAGWVVAWPCGDVIRPDLARILATIL